MSFKDSTTREFKPWRLVVGFVLLTHALGEIISPKPENQAVHSGKRVKFRCNSSHGPPVIAWSFVGLNGSRNAISAGSFVYPNFVSSVEVEQSNLIIKNATSQWVGTYMCYEGGTENKEISAQLIVVESDPVSSSNISEVKELFYNQSVMMSCSLVFAANTAIVEAKMTWYSDNKMIGTYLPSYSSSREETTATSVIHVDGGYVNPFPTHHCLVTFQVIATERHATNIPTYTKTSSPPYSNTISVFYIDPDCSITGAESIDYVYTGTTLKCHADANPLVTERNIIWTNRHDGKSVNGSTIQIWHSGEYVCVGKNTVGECAVVVNIVTYSVDDEKMALYIAMACIGLGCVILVIASAISAYYFLKVKEAELKETNANDERRKKQN